MSNQRDFLNKLYNTRKEMIDKDLSLEMDKLLKPKNEGNTEMIKVSNISFLEFLDFIIASSLKTDKYSNYVIPTICNYFTIGNKDVIIIGVQRVCFENCDLEISSNEIISLLNKNDCIASVIFSDCIFVNSSIKFDRIISSYIPNDLISRCCDNLSRLKYEPDFMGIDIFKNFEIEEIKLDKKLTSCCFVNSRIQSINLKPEIYFNGINYYSCVENIGNLNSDEIYKKDVKYGYKYVKARLTNPTKKMLEQNDSLAFKRNILFLPILLKVKVPKDAQVVEPIYQSCDSHPKLRASKLIPVEASIIVTDSNYHINLIPIKSKYIKAKYIKRSLAYSDNKVFDEFELKFYTGKFESLYNNDFCYRLNEEIIPDRFDNDLLNQCSSGLHFFENKGGAIEYYYAYGGSRCGVGTEKKSNSTLLEQIIIEDK